MSTNDSHPEMQYRSLGSTRERVSVIGVGGYHLGLKHVDERLSIRIVRAAIDAGINFMDNCWDYNAGLSEIRMGKALREGYRDRVFLMSKIDGRSRGEARRQLEESLRRLRVDCIDLVQHHEILRYEDPHRIFDEDGANAALLEAREAGKLRYIGFAGHKDPRIHLHMLEVATEMGFAFDTIQMPLNVMDAHYRSFEKMVLPEAVKRNIGVIAMKSMADGVLLKSKTVSPLDCLHYVMNLPTSVVVTGIDRLDVLDQALEAVRTFHALDKEHLTSLLARTEKAASNGEFEPYKTTSLCDDTATHPEWLGEESVRVRQIVTYEALGPE